MFVTDEAVSGCACDGVGVSGELSEFKASAEGLAVACACDELAVSGVAV